MILAKDVIKLFFLKNTQIYTIQELAEKINYTESTINTHLSLLIKQKIVFSYTKCGIRNKIYYTSNKNFDNKNFKKYPNYEMNLNFY